MEPKTEVVRWKGRLYQTPLEPEETPKPLSGSAVGVCINGEWQVRTLDYNMMWNDARQR